MEYVKLSSLVGLEFEVNRVVGFKFKAWDNENKKMIVSDKFEKGYRKMYQVETDRGLLDISASQMGNLLEGVSQAGKADINHRTFTVRSNGKTGMEIRYYLNPVWAKVDKVVDVEPDEEINLEDIPY
jgi:hypothetical protein